MKVSVLLTINDRPLGILGSVYSSLKQQPYDEMIVVLDRVPDAIHKHISLEWARYDDRVKMVNILGEPGWRSPVPAWNTAFRAATGDWLFAFSSEVVHASQNVAVARRMLEENANQAIFGRCSCSCGPEGKEVVWGDNAPGNLLVDSLHPRPLGFIWASTVKAVRAVGGMDPMFAQGLAYDDDDFFYRLWRSGLDFAFTDEISGTHMHHERPVFATEAGQAAIRHNASYLAGKYGTTQLWAMEARTVRGTPGLTQWIHPGG